MLVHHLIFQGKQEDFAFLGARDEAVTYRQLQSNVAAYRNFFYAQGVREGENVGLFSKNCVEFVYSYLAIVSLGAVVVPLNFQLTEQEAAYILQDAQVKHLVTERDMDLPVTRLVFSKFKEAVALANDPAAPVLEDSPENEQRPCAVIYTSGTTGKPKGAVLSHRNLISNAHSYRQVLPMVPEDRVLCVLPMYHCFAWTCSVLTTLLGGAAITILDAFAPKETLAAIREYQVTVIYAVPTMYNVLLRTGEEPDLASLRACISGGAPLPEKIAKRFQEKFGQEILEGYGLSEASPVVSLNPPGRVKPCSIGRPLPAVTVKIDGGKGIVPPGTVGELLVQGPNVMLGYYNLPQETARALRQGWLHTGDLAYLDAEGYIYIVDRLKDMIIVSGENIYPREIEELLYKYPGVIEAAVIGVPDELRGQAARAYLVFAEGYVFNKKELRDYLQAALAAYKVPKDFVVLDVLPKNQTGKILKRVLRDRALGEEADREEKEE